MNTEKLLKLLKAMSEGAYSLYEDCHRDRKHAMARQFIGQSLAFDSVIFCLQDPEHFNHLCEIYGIAE